MTSEKAWPCQEGKRKTGVRKDGGQGIHFSGPSWLPSWCICWPSRVSCKMKCGKDIILKMRKRESWSTLSYLRQESNKACWALRRLPEVAGEQRKWRQREKPDSSHSPELSRPALYEVIPRPRPDRDNDQKTAAKRLPGFAFSKTRGGLGHFPPPLPTPRPATSSFRGLLIGAPVKLQEQSVW